MTSNLQKLKNHKKRTVWVRTRGNGYFHAVLMSLILYAIILKCYFVICFQLDTTFDWGIPLLRTLPKGDAKARQLIMCFVIHHSDIYNGKKYPIGAG